MLHPDLVLKRSLLGGRGLFAEKKLSMGTVIWKWDEKHERIYTKTQIQGFNKLHQQTILKYGSEYPGGRINYSTDKSKYWNHSCDPNTAPFMSILFFMDIVIRDIYPGEEITFDYSLIISPKWPISFRCNCGSNKCRGVIPGLASKSKTLANLGLVSKNAEKNVLNVDQPLLDKDKDILKLWFNSGR